ncbi:MAG: glycosyltransferase family 4 protein [Rhodocyclaceae bacterium]|nr:glycosyltransferase family 4 protein [Rhodocyclaceae bacterium]
MKHILIISNLFPPAVIGGAEKIAAQLALLLKSRYKVTVLTLSGNGQDVVDNWNGIKVYRLAIRNSYYPFAEASPSAMRKLLWHRKDAWNQDMREVLRPILASEKPDIVNTHNLAGFSVSAWAAADEVGVPVVHTMHDYYLLCPKSTMFCKERNCQSQCWGCRLLSDKKISASQRVKHVVSVSNFVLQRHLSNGYFKNAARSVIANARDFHRKPPGPAVPAGDLKFGYIGRISENKGVEKLLQVFRKCFSHHKLFIAGAGEPSYVEMLQKKYGSSNIVFMGYVDANTFFVSIDINIVPSRWNDPFPTVVFESFYHSVPVIGSRRGGIPEMVVDGVNGFLYEPDEDGALERVLAKAVSDSQSYQRLSAGAYESGAYYRTDRFFAQYAEVFESLAC